MKYILPLLTLLMSQSLTAQQLEKFYDINWKECEPVQSRYYSSMVKTDSGWSRTDYYVQEKKLYRKGLYADTGSKSENGYFAYYHSNGRLQKTGRFIHHKKDGLWMGYHKNGRLADSAVFKNDLIYGTKLAWNDAGVLIDSTVLDKKGAGTAVFWYPDRKLSAMGAYSEGKKENGTWIYYHANGNKSSAERYKNGKFINRKYFDENGLALTDTTNAQQGASFPGGAEAWKKYLVQNLKLPEGYKIEHSDRATVVIEFIVDTGGNIQEANISVPFHPAFDQIALSIISNSPKWNPATDKHNRKVKAYRRQPVTFAQIHKR
ncbi:energy transducer TonB [Niabella yanshanensis]|uniref:Energy transducer TonB n=1 Tax=Niabella yanshanensis TaxID=577386 RepID=A0ABZ0W1G6_9BACT|nr:energy transducer TonB [Niabella yanshanensis]WQD36419.1 energy transducer TonB [Niabella yanshanensis]